jgi:hypothetical protein
MCKMLLPYAVKKFKIPAQWYLLSISVKLNALLCAGGGGVGGVPTFFKQIQRKYFFDREIEIVSISSVKVLFPTSMILKKDSGDEHKYCTTLMEKTVRGIGILNSDLFSDQFFYSVWNKKCLPLIRGSFTFFKE